MPAAPHIKRFLPFMVLAVLAVPLFFMNVLNAHGLGDDYAQYIREAVNISKGQPYYQSGYIFNSLQWEYAPPQYPPGWPLLLAPVVSVFGIAIKPMMYYNSIIVATLLFALYAYFRRYGGMVVSVCLSLIIVYSETIMDLKGNILSDIPCLLFTVFYLLARRQASRSFAHILLLSALAVMVVLIRSQGLLLLGAEGMYLLGTIGRSLKDRTFSVRSVIDSVSFRVLCCASVLFLLVNRFVFPAPQSSYAFYLKMITHYPGSVSDMMADNLDYLKKLFWSFLHITDTPHGFYRMMINSEHLMLILTVIGLVISIVKEVKVDDFLFILVCLMIIAIPERQGIRFLLPVFPMYMLYAFFSLRALWQWLLKNRGYIPVTLFTIIYLVANSKVYAKYSKNQCSGCAPSAELNVFFDYIKTHVPDNEAIVFPLPRLLTLYTGKRTIVYSRHASVAENKQKFAEHNVHYIFPWYSDEIRSFMRANYVIADSIDLGGGTFYHIR